MILSDTEDPEKRPGEITAADGAVVAALNALVFRRIESDGSKPVVELENPAGETAKTIKETANVEGRVLLVAGVLPAHEAVHFTPVGSRG